MDQAEFEEIGSAQDSPLLQSLQLVTSWAGDFETEEEGTIDAATIQKRQSVAQISEQEIPDIAPSRNGSSLLDQLPARPKGVERRPTWNDEFEVEGPPARGGSPTKAAAAQAAKAKTSLSIETRHFNSEANTPILGAFQGQSQPGQGERLLFNTVYDAAPFFDPDTPTMHAAANGPAAGRRKEHPPPRPMIQTTKGPVTVTITRMEDSLEGLPQKASPGQRMPR